MAAYRFVRLRITEGGSTMRGLTGLAGFLDPVAVEELHVWPFSSPQVDEQRDDMRGDVLREGSFVPYFSHSPTTESNLDLEEEELLSHHQYTRSPTSRIDAPMPPTFAEQMRALATQAKDNFVDMWRSTVEAGAEVARPQVTLLGSLAKAAITTYAVLESAALAIFYVLPIAVVGVAAKYLGADRTAREFFGRAKAFTENNIKVATVALVVLGVGAALSSFSLLGAASAAWAITFSPVANMAKAAIGAVATIWQPQIHNELVAEQNEILDPHVESIIAHANANANANHISITLDQADQFAKNTKLAETGGALAMVAAVGGTGGMMLPVAAAAVGATAGHKLVNLYHNYQANQAEAARQAEQARLAAAEQQAAVEQQQSPGQQRSPSPGMEGV